MKNVQKIDLGLTGYDELFANDEERKVNKLPHIFDIPISEIDDFPDHPYQVRLDEDMERLVESIKLNGVITPVTLRKKDDGRYEMVSGHRRKKACEIAGLETVKAEVKELTKDEASSTLIAYAVAVIGMIAPLLVLGFNMTKSGTAKAERLCSSMTVVTNSYLSTEDIIRSVSENLDNLDYPAPFRSFLAYVTHMDSDVQHGLRRMEAEVNNPYFSQWIDALCIAQGDRALKYVSVSVVESMRDVISAQQESDAAMFAVWRDYLLTLILIFSVPLIFKFMMPDAYVTLTTSAAGQSMFMLLLGAVLFSVFRALRINTPIV